jgi:hypothetical protein
VREPVQWRVLQPQANGPYQWSVGSSQSDSLDTTYDLSIAHHQRPIWVVLDAPSWAAKTGCVDGVGKCVPDASDPAKLSAFQSFVQNLVARYPLTRAVEIWNEEGSTNFWPGGANPADYAKVLCAGYDGARAGRPNVPVLIGGLEDAGTTGGNMEPQPFLHAMYQALNGRRCADGVGLHPYTFGLDPAPAGSRYRYLLASVRNEISISDPGRHIWVTEYGNTTYTKPLLGNQTTAPATEAQQSQWTMFVYNDLTSSADIDAMIVHRLADQPDLPFNSTPEKHFGVVRADGSHKPVFDALQSMRSGVTPLP